VKLSWFTLQGGGVLFVLALHLWWSFIFSKKIYSDKQYFPCVPSSLSSLSSHDESVWIFAAFQPPPPFFFFLIPSSNVSGCLDRSNGIAAATVHGNFYKYLRNHSPVFAAMRMKD